MKKVLKILALVLVAFGFVGCGNNVFKRVATTRSESTATLKVIVEKVFADNIDTTKATAPSGESWGEWIMTIANLDKAKWAISSSGVYPIDTKSKQPCHNSSKTPLIWINSQTGAMHFNPSKLADDDKGFCGELRNSYDKDRIIPLAASATSAEIIHIPYASNVADSNNNEANIATNDNMAQSNDSGNSIVADSSNVAQSNDSGFVVVEVSGDSVCNSYKRDDFSSKSIVDFFKPKQFENLAVRYYNGEIKVDNKETLCVYMDTLGQGYLNINLTPQELEQFDRFLIEKSSSDSYAKYENSEEVQNYLLTALKFFKYYNKLDELYGKEFITIDNDRYSLNNLYRFASWLKGYENDYIIEVRRFLYDKDMGIYPNTSIMTLFPYYSREKLNDLSGDYPALASIAKWAEQKLKEAR